jgi:murein DD-endopeptidase MepM/ murein hydrolase activator NlpD
MLFVAAGLLLASRPAAAGRPPPVRPAPAGPSAARPIADAAPPAVVRYTAPVRGAVLRPFLPPPTPYAAGHRGVDLAAPAGAPVRAAADGVVRFAGPVAGRGVLVIAHPDGVSTEYEPVRPLVAAGTAVVRGEPVARVSGRHVGCPRSCLHWGARRGGVYLDPLTLLRPLGPVVLLPWPRDG